MYQQTPVLWSLCRLQLLLQVHAAAASAVCSMSQDRRTSLAGPVTSYCPVTSHKGTMDCVEVTEGSQNVW